MKIDWAVPLLIAGVTALDSLQRWYWSFDRDVMENQAIEFRWISWGAIRAYGRPDFDRRYFVMYFPGRHWERDFLCLEYAWHKRGVIWIQGEGWREIFCRCPERIESFCKHGSTYQDCTKGCPPWPV